MRVLVEDHTAAELLADVGHRQASHRTAHIGRRVRGAGRLAQPPVRKVELLVERRRPLAARVVQAVAAREALVKVQRREDPRSGLAKQRDEHHLGRRRRGQAAQARQAAEPVDEQRVVVHVARLHIADRILEGRRAHLVEPHCDDGNIVGKVGDPRRIERVVGPRDGELRDFERRLVAHRAHHVH